MPDNQPSPDTTINLHCKTCRRAYPLGTESCPDDGGDLVSIDYAALIGTTFADKYEIQSILGQGGMSIVYKARHIYMGRTVAVKLLLEDDCVDPHSFKRFQQEAQAASSLSHQNIVIVYDFGVTQQGQPYFVMDCLEGASLEDYIDANGRMPLDKAVDVFRQICDGLAHAHKKGVIHRDLKPSNVVLAKEEDGTETVKIVDFGLAKVQRQDMNKHQPRLTQTGQILGSPMYMSPEQCQGYAMDARSDIYSLGCLMYETLAGVPPFSADSFFNMALLHIHQQPPKFSEVSPDPGVSRELEQVIFKCLAKDPAERYENVEQVRQKMLDAALVSGIPGVKAGAVPIPSNDKHSPFKKTWENMRAIIDAQSKLQNKKKRSPVQMIATTCGVLAITASIGVYFFWPGIEGDIGTPFEKQHWQILMSLAQQSMGSRDYAAAERYLKDAHDVAATKFVDNHARLRLTVERQAELYTLWHKHTEEDKANTESAEILTMQIKDEAAGVMHDLSQIGTNPRSDTERLDFQSAASAIMPRVLTSSQRLKSRGLIREDEKMLKQASDVLKKVGLQSGDQTANILTALADNYLIQQRLAEVRPLLESAADIRKGIAQDGSKRSLANYIQSELRLGQFDRDQSSYDKAKAELQDALSLTEKSFTQNHPLMYDAINSYADLARQMGDTDLYKQLVKKAKPYAQ